MAASETVAAAAAAAANPLCALCVPVATATANCDRRSGAPASPPRRPFLPVWLRWRSVGGRRADGLLPSLLLLLVRPVSREFALLLDFLPPRRPSASNLVPAAAAAAAAALLLPRALLLPTMDEDDEDDDEDRVAAIAAARAAGPSAAKTRSSWNGTVSASRSKRLRSPFHVSTSPRCSLRRPPCCCCGRGATAACGVPAAAATAPGPMGEGEDGKDAATGATPLALPCGNRASRRKGNLAVAAASASLPTAQGGDAFDGAAAAASAADNDVPTPASPLPSLFAVGRSACGDEDEDADADEDEDEDEDVGTPSSAAARASSTDRIGAIKRRPRAMSGRPR